MKVIHLTTVDMSLELLLGPQLDAIRDQGFDVIGVSSPGPWVSGLEARGIRHIPLTSSTRGWNPFADVRAARDLWRVLRGERPVVLHTHNPKPGLYGRVLGRLAGVPVVVNTVHGLFATPDDPALKRLVVYSLEAVASRFSDAELVQSAEDLDLMRRLRLAPRSKLTHLGNGVDLHRFDPARIHDDEVAELRAELGLDPGVPVVGMVGRLVTEKGWRELFEAVERVVSSGRPLQVLAIGPTDPDKSDAISQEEMTNAEKSGVRFLGLRDDMPQLYGLIDVFCLPSHREGFPRSAMEAAAMGVPVIASDIRGCREVVVDGETGILVPVRDPSALASAIGSLLDEPERRTSMGKRAHELALERFDVERVVETVLSTYRTVARSKGLELLPRDNLRPALPTEAKTIARLHMEGIDTGFLTSLGLRALTALYRALITDLDSVVLVAAGETGSPTGFVAGSRHVSTTYRRVLIRNGWRIGLAAVPSLVAKPSRMARAIETLRYPSQEDEPELPEAELLAMAVEQGHRSSGLGQSLVDALLEEMASPAVRVVVGLDNEGARRFYRRVGFEHLREMSVHEDAPSEMLVWRSSPAS